VKSVINDPCVLEILIIDDGSTDGSSQIAREFSEKYGNIRFLQHPNRENKGATASRNLGLTHAKSDWIQFLDADDELLEGKLSGQINLVKADLTFIVGNSIDVFPNGRRHLRKSDNEIWKGLIRSKLGITSSNLWNKKYMLEIGGWDNDLSSSQEYDLMFKLVCIQPKVGFDSRPKTLIHKTENSISKDLKKKNQRIHNWLNLRNEIRDHLIKIGNFGIKNQYFWSGTVGTYCELQQSEFPKELNLFLFRLYKLELKIKSEIHQLIKTK
jgi:glycosyltransferase involved in cell wall biosynthesis